jgi:hypothetical protein
VGDDFTDEYPDGDPLAAEVLATLVRTGHAIDAEIDRAMVASHGWPQTILNCLAVIEGADTSLTPSQIGERTLTSSATMTNTLDTLEHLGWARHPPAGRSGTGRRPWAVHGRSSRRALCALRA